MGKYPKKRNYRSHYGHRVSSPDYSDPSSPLDASLQVHLYHHHHQIQAHPLMQCMVATLQVHQNHHLTTTTTTTTTISPSPPPPSPPPPPQPDYIEPVFSYIKYLNILKVLLCHLPLMNFID